MVYTYRSPRSKSSLFGVLGLPFLLLIAVPVIVTIVAWDNVVDGAWGIGISLIAAWLVYRFAAYSRCFEIRLSDDGWCELEARRRVVRVHASQIRSIETDGDGEASIDYYIKFDGGEMGVGDGWADFEDFVRRLQALNPSVDLTGFRAIQSRDE